MSKRTFAAGFHSVYRQNKLTLGIGVPIEAYQSPVPTMQHQLDRIKRVEQGGFAGLWCRDVPLLDPSFGDAGQMYDPWVWLGYIAAHTSTIALGTGSIILPLRKPVDLAKAAASVDQLSNGRLVLGVASGDRPVEYSVYEVPFEARDQSFRETLEMIKAISHRPQNWDNQLAVHARKVDMLPKCFAGDLPIFITGNSRQSIDWIAENGDGWLMYPRPLAQQREVVKQWHSTLEKLQQPWKPFSQSLYVDLTENPDSPATPIHLGYKLGRNTLIAHLQELQNIGVNHVTFNIRFSSRNVDDVIDEMCKYVVPNFPAHKVTAE